MRDPDPTHRFTVGTWPRKHAPGRLDLKFWTGIGVGCLLAGLVIGCALYRLAGVISG